MRGSISRERLLRMRNDGQFPQRWVSLLLSEEAIGHWSACAPLHCNLAIACAKMVNLRVRRAPQQKCNAAIAVSGESSGEIVP